MQPGGDQSTLGLGSVFDLECEESGGYAILYLLEMNCSEPASLWESLVLHR